MEEIMDECKKFAVDLIAAQIERAKTDGSNLRLTELIEYAYKSGLEKHKKRIEKIESAMKNFMNDCGDEFKDSSDITEKHYYIFEQLLRK